MSDMGTTVGAANIRVMPNTKNFSSSLKKFLERMERTHRLDVKLGLDEGDFAGEVRRAVSAAQAVAGDLDIEVDVDSSGTASEARRAKEAAEAAAGKIEIPVDLDRSAVAALSGSLMRVVGAAGAATVAMGGLAPAIAATATAAAAAAGQIAAVGAAMAPAAILSAAGAVGVLKASFSGFGDALQADNLDDFNAAIEQLPASAQEGARALYGLKQSFTDVGQEVQGAFWANISNIGDLANLVEPVRRAMSGLAVDMGNAAAGLVGFVSQGAGLSAVKTLLHGSSSAAGSLSYAFADVLKGIVSVGAAAAPVFADLSAKAAEVASAWGERMTAAFVDGSLQEYFSGAVETARQFGAFMGQLGGIVSGVWSAMNAAGAPFLGTLGQAVQSTNEWVNSAQGMGTLVSFFESMSGAVGALMPVLGSLAGIIGGTVAPAIAEFAEALGPGLQAAVDGVGRTLSAIAPYASAFGSALGAVLSAVGPLLPVIAALVPVLSAAGSAFGVLQSIIPAVTGVLAGLSWPLVAVGAALALLGVAIAQTPGLMEPLKTAFTTLIAAIQPVVQILMQVGQQIIAALMPAFAALVPVIAMIISFVAQVIAALTPILAVIGQLVAAIVGALMPVITALIPVLSLVITVASAIVSALAPIISVVSQVVGAFVRLLGIILGFVAQALAAIISFVTGVVSGFVSMVGSVIGTVAGWVSSVLGFFRSLGSGALSAARSMWSSVSSAFSSGVSSAVSFVASMPGRVLGALGNVGGLLVASGRALIQGFINGIRSMVGAVADAARGVVQAARNFFPFSPAKTGPFSGRGWVLYSGQSLGEAFAQGISDRVADAAAASKELMGAAAGNLNGYRAGVGGVAGAAGLGPTADYSVHIGTVVAADPEKPIKDAQEMQLKARIRGGVA